MKAVAKTQPTRQIAFRLPGKMSERLEAVAARYALDVSNFLRLVLSEQLSAYERRAEQMEKGGEEEDDK